MSKIPLLIFCFLCTLFSCFGQVSIEGKITDGKEGLPFATVLLLRTDSSMVIGAITETTGKFTLKSVVAGKYIVSSSIMGYTKFYSGFIEVKHTNILLPDILMNEGATALNEVTVTASKPFVEQEIDRTIVNVQGSVTSAGNSILQILQKSPGVVVNSQTNTLTLNGKSGVRIMINDKAVQVPLDVALQMLDGMGSSNVEKIELITTPPAKYDADGSAGIIHIVTKKNADLGTSGSVGLTLGYRAAETYGGNFTYNLRRKKFAFLVDYSAMRNHNVHTMRMNRASYNNGFLRTTSDESDRENNTNQQNLNAVVEWNLSDNTTLNIGFTGYRRKWTLTALSTDDNHVAIDSTVFTRMNIVESNVWQSGTGGIGLQTKVNSKSEAFFSLDYLYYHNDNPSTYDNEVFYNESRKTESSLIDLKKDTPIHIFVAKADYVYSPSPELTIELGGKGTSSSLDNKVLVQRLAEGVWTADPAFTSQSTLSEQIGGIYFSTKWKPAKQWQVNSGLRYEYSHTTISTPTQQNLINRKYGYFFPSIFITKDIDAEKNVQISYSRRITRPTYNDMAPYVFLWGPNTFSGGNTSLLPAIADAVKLGYNIKQLGVSFQFTHSRNEINSYQPELDEESNSLTYRSQNLKYLNTLGLAAFYSLTITPSWEIQANLTGQYQTAQASHVQHDATLHLYGLNMNLVSLIRLPHDIVIEISGMYQSKTLSGITTYLPLGSLNAGIQKKLGEGGALKLSMDDILNTNYWRITSSSDNGVNSYFKYNFHNQYIRLVFTQQLGNNKLRSTRLRSGSEEEKRRVGN